VQEVSRRSPLLFVLIVSLVPVLGLFTTRNIFYVRDLSFFFWSRHLWLRHTIFAGEAPWWDPHVAAGQSAIADALNQLLMPLTLAVRLLPSDVVSFNLWVALPIPLAAAGTFVFLRRRVGDGAAALGACAFALSGPVVSMINAPNLSWSVALLPWVLWTVETRRITLLAIAFALQGLSGEPVTWAATAAIAAAYAAVSRERLADPIRAVLGLAAGGGLAAAQLAPTLLAGVRAHRSALAMPDFWSLHPLSLWETLAPQLFGNYYGAFLADLPWMGALNFGRDPFFYSLYVGPLVLLLAGIGAVSQRRHLFWVAVLLVFLVASLGGYTPLYPIGRRLVPALMYFRFPVKYIVFAIFACAVLAAEGWARIAEALREERPLPSLWLPAAIAGTGLALAIAAFALPDAATRAMHWLAVSTHLKDPAAGAAFLARAAPPLAARASALLLAGTMLLALICQRHGGPDARRRLAAWVLFGAVCADLAITNRDLSPTASVASLSPPAWYVASAGPARLYVGGRARGWMNPNDPDATTEWDIPAASTAVEGRMQLNADLPMAPSGWRVREALSYDLPYLWPAEYDATLRRFEQAEPGPRAAFLRRAAVRRCVLPVSQHHDFPAIAEVPGWKMRVYDCHPAATRVFIAPAIEVAADPADLAWQRDALFDVSLPDDVVRLDVRPPVAGVPSAPAGPSARIVEDGTTRVTIEAALAEPAVLVLRDSYDPSWHVEVDGAPGRIARANGLYRAVALPAGRHVIRFFYRPRDLALGLMITAMTALVLAIAGVRTAQRRRGRRRADAAAGFTLIELMVVLAIVAILLAIAFTSYRGMQARGNEASAVASLRSIAAAQSQFAMTCGNLKYAAKLPALGQPVPATGQAFLSPDLTSAETFEKSGYMFQMAAKPLDTEPPACNGAVVAEGYAATADPVNPGVSGTNFYGINSDRVLYYDPEKTFTGELPESGAAGHGLEVK
jgi:prepilin-type N-terminal cleavage/methylation domain-containing protein